MIYSLLLLPSTFRTVSRRAPLPLLALVRERNDLGAEKECNALVLLQAERLFPFGVEENGDVDERDLVVLLEGQ